MANRLSWVFHVDSVPMTRAVVAGETSLGGSESACLGLARALRARGHDVTIMATRMASDVPERDAVGVRWLPAESLAEAQKLIDPDVFVALRQPHVFSLPVQARYRIMWNQDMLVGEGAKHATMARAWAYDRIAYVSEYQRKQWEGVCHEIAPLGWVTKNGFDPAMVPTDVVRVPNRIIHISRPERAMTPLLAMWPELKRRAPDAELHICRYASMYDGEGSQVKAMVEAFDAEIARVNTEVGGIVQLGQLNKRDLYRAIASASVMWYPGVHDFAETSCWTPDTPVAIPGGHKRIDQVKAGDLVLSYSEREKRIVAKRVKWCKQTGTDREVMTLTYKWRFGRSAGKQESITGTPDHRLLRRDGTWTTLSELAAGDSLMPMFRKGDGTYVEVGHDGSSYRYEHAIVGEALAGRALCRGEIVHHEDGDGQNNDESNLRVMRQSDHIRHHKPRCPRKALDIEAMHAMRRSGMPQHAIAAALGTTQATISRRLVTSNHSVVSVVPAGRSDVWDMEVEDTHTFIAGHVVAHNCIAAIEAQACGTPIVCSYKGALPETAPHASFVIGDAMSASYQEQSINEVVDKLNSTFEGERLLGLQHVRAYTYDAIAAEWEASIWASFDARAKAAPEAVAAALLHEDDVCAALAVTSDQDVIADSWRVIRGEEQTAEHYGKYALDPEKEMTTHRQGRHLAVVDAFTDCAHILDLACGNGAFAIMLALARPDRRVIGVDYSQQNVDVARVAAERHGVSDRVMFYCQTLCSLETGAIDADAIPIPQGGPYDGVFLGEFCEHVAGVEHLLNDVAGLIGSGAHVVITVPSGPFSEMLPVDMVKQRGHVHHFRPRDLDDMFDGQTGYTVDYLTVGTSPRGAALGHWVVRYRTSAVPVQPRPLAHWARTIRPMQRVSVGILAHNATGDLNKCLGSIWPIADEIIVADTGSDDRQELEHICQRFKAKLITIPAVQSLEGGFSQARNLTLDAATGEWFLWIDADEELIGNGNLSKYLPSGIFRGYAVIRTISCSTRRSMPIRQCGCLSVGQTSSSMASSTSSRKWATVTATSYRRSRSSTRRLPIPAICTKASAGISQWRVIFRC